MKKQHIDPEAVVKEMFWLAWQACGGPLGMGMFQDNPAADKESVWKNVYDAGDYPGGKKMAGFRRNGGAYGDYVFGRMMKLYIELDAESLEFSDNAPRIDFQSWCGKYPTYEALYDAAVKSLAA